MNQITNKNELGFNNDQEIVNTIMSTIRKYHPDMDKRYLYIREKEKADMEINFDFVNENGNDLTCVSFFDCPRTSCMMTNLHEFLEIDGLVTENCLFNLINSILLDHSVVSVFDVNETSITIRFNINYTSDSKGISCDTISLLFDFFAHDKQNDLKESYLNFFALNFLDKFKKTTYFSNALQRYFKLHKDSFIEGLDSDGLRKFIGLLSDKELINIIYEIKDERFMELKDSYDDNYSLKLKK